MSMDPRTDLRGIVTVLNTPFTEDDHVDTQGLAAHVQQAITEGVAGFLVPAMASEVGLLTEEERAIVVDTVLHAADGAVPVIGGASADDAETRLRIATELVARGCDGVLVSLPYLDAAQYAEAVAAAAACGTECLMIQDWDAGGYGVPVDQIATLFARHDNFRCLKVEVVPAGPKYSEVIAATDGHLHVSGGWAVTQMIDALDRGVHAFMPTGLHAVYTRIYRLYRDGDREAAQALHERLLPILTFSNQHLDVSIHFFKRLLHAQGIYATPRVRVDSRRFDAVHARAAAAYIARAQALVVECGGSGVAPSPARTVGSRVSR